MALMKVSRDGFGPARWSASVTTTAFSHPSSDVNPACAEARWARQAFTSVCTKEVCAFRDAIGDYQKLAATVYGISVDSRGDLYVGEVSWTQWPQFYPDTPRPAYIRSLQKYERVR